MEQKVPSVNTRFQESPTDQVLVIPFFVKLDSTKTWCNIWGRTEKRYFGTSELCSFLTIKDSVLSSVTATIHIKNTTLSVSKQETCSSVPTYYYMVSEKHRLSVISLSANSWKK